MKPAPICYIDHATGESDHMNAHIQTSKCAPSSPQAQAETAEPITATHLADYMSMPRPRVIDTDSPLWYDAIRLLREHAALTRERDEARAALRKVRAHTSHHRGADNALLAGLLQSIERIADAALASVERSVSPDQDPQG